MSNPMKTKRSFQEKLPLILAFVIPILIMLGIFAGKSITESNPTTGNPDGIDKTIAIMDRDFDGLCFVNLVDTDMIYGHRRDIPGYAQALILTASCR